MPRYPHELDLEPARPSDAGHEDAEAGLRARDPDDAIVESDRSVARHADEAEEAELAEEDLLELAEREEELEARRGVGTDE